MLNQQPVSGDKVSHIVDLPSRQIQRLRQQRLNAETRQPAETPYWTQPLPVPPAIDAQAQTQDDLKTLALVAAVRQLADQNDNTVQDQLNVWVVD